MDVEQIKAALDAHVYRDVLGDYEIAPYYKHFGCSCGWEQNIAGMSGWRSWGDAYRAHVAEVIVALMPEVSESVEWGVRYGDGEVELCWCREDAKEIVASVRRGVAEGVYNADDYEPVTFVRRIVTTYASTVGEWTEVADA